MHVTYARGSVLLWRRRDTLRISGLWVTSYLHIRVRFVKNFSLCLALLDPSARTTAATERTVPYMLSQCSSVSKQKCIADRLIAQVDAA